MNLKTLIQELKRRSSWRQKQQLRQLSEEWMNAPGDPRDQTIRLGDDAAVLPREDTDLLLASELILPDLVVNRPRLAGRSAILANVNDVYAMGGTPIAVQDVVLSSGSDHLREIKTGLAEAARRYRVPVVGGHLTVDDGPPTLGVFILGETAHPLSSFEVQPGDALLMAIHLEGEFETEHAFWNGTVHRTDGQLREDLGLLPDLAEDDLCSAARDISMPGVLGSALMLLEASNLGALIELDKIPRPPQARGRTLDWLTAFPSYGFLLAVDPGDVSPVRSRFEKRSIACEQIGRVNAEPKVWLHSGPDRELLWDFELEAFTGFTR